MVDYGTMVIGEYKFYSDISGLRIEILIINIIQIFLSINKRKAIIFKISGVAQFRPSRLYISISAIW